MWTVCILESTSRNGKIYIGSTGNISSRLIDHNRGGTPSTKNFIPWRVVYTEEYETKAEAIKRERQLKGWKNRVRINNLIIRDKYL